ncbi:MAG: hypothetical protein C0459_05375 [Chitinophaga sp.]|jgi:hypothetical protein|nr:hypothetical protein [Chitinophaga sp.]
MRNLLILLLITMLAACSKQADNTAVTTTTPQFVTYTILKGRQFSDSTTISVVNTTEMKFVALFDSSAVYKTIDPNNQADINKLYGFSDNNSDHHQFSARFGWNWLNDGLHLWAYDYNYGNRDYKDLGLVSIGKEINCSIKVTTNQYIFSVNGKETIMVRSAGTAVGSGYKLFPYFGGQEYAPHDITIQIKEL